MKANNKEDRQQEMRLTPYCRRANYLLKMYGTKALTVKDEAETINSKQPGRMTAVRYSEDLWEKKIEVPPYIKKQI